MPPNSCTRTCWPPQVGAAAGRDCAADGRRGTGARRACDPAGQPGHRALQALQDLHEPFLHLGGRRAALQVQCVRDAERGPRGVLQHAGRGGTQVRRRCLRGPSVHI